MQQYGVCAQSGMDLTTSEGREEFADWQLRLTFDTGDVVVILCCPEDRRCSQCGPATSDVCAACEVPLCTSCERAMMEGIPSEPAPKALANDMMICHAPKELYEDKLSVLEMICCSVCLTSMICFSMEVKYGHMLDSTVHMQRHRVGVRGNATTFLLPWEALLAECTRLEEEIERRQSPLLPRSGSELASIVQVLLKANDSASQQHMTNFIHQAKVRSDVVVRHILHAKARGHRGYAHIEECMLAHYCCRKRCTA